MPIQITIELIPQGDEMRRRKLAIVTVINDNTGNQELGNYQINAEGECAVNGESVGWDIFDGFPKYLIGMERKYGYLHLAAKALDYLLRENY